MRNLISRCARRHTAVAAYLALFSALGGSAYAIEQVTSAQIADETITAQDIGAGQVQYGEIAANSITSDKISDGAVTAGDIGWGQVKSDDVASKAIKPHHLDVPLKVTRVSALSYAGMGKWKVAEVACPAGYEVVGGGGTIHDGLSGDGGGRLALTSSRPMSDGAGWRVTARAIAFDTPGQTWDTAWSVQVWAQCATL